MDLLRARGLRPRHEAMAGSGSDRATFAALISAFVLGFQMTQGLAQTPPQLPAALQAKMGKLSSARDAARIAGDRTAEAQALNAMGVLYGRAALWSEEQRSFTEALAVARAAQDAVDEGAALNGLGDTYRAQAQFPQALEQFQKALDAAQKIDNEPVQVAAMNGLGWVQASLGQLDKAQELHESALALAQKARDEAGQAFSLRRLAALELGRQNPAKALKLSARALEIYRAAHDDAGTGAAINNMAVAHLAMKEKSKALEEYAQALDELRTAGDRVNEAMVLNNLGQMYQGDKDWEKAIENYAAAGKVWEAAGNTPGVAADAFSVAQVDQLSGASEKAIDEYSRSIDLYGKTSLNGMVAFAQMSRGEVYLDLEKPEKALADEQQALTFYRTVGGAAMAQPLQDQAMALMQLKRTEEALAGFSQAASLYAGQKNVAMEAWMHAMEGEMAQDLGKRKEAEAAYNKALVYYRPLAGKPAALALKNLGIVYELDDQHDEALKCFVEAQPLFHKAGDAENEAWTDYFAAEIVWNGEKMADALDWYGRAADLFAAAGLPKMEAQARIYTGDAYLMLEQREKAMVAYEKGEVLFEEAKDDDGLGLAHLKIGKEFFITTEREKALKEFRDSLTHYAAAKDQPGVDGALLYIGMSEFHLGHPKEAMDDLNRALPNAAKEEDKGTEAQILGLQGTIYSTLGDKRKALELLGQALTLERAGNNGDELALVLNDMGTVYQDLREWDKALEKLNEAVPLFLKYSDKYHAAAAGSNIGLVYLGEGRLAEALAQIERVLPELRSSHDHDVLGQALNGMAVVYYNLGNYAKGLETMKEALALAKEVGDPNHVALAMTNMATIYAAQGDLEKALDLFQQSIAIYERAGGLNGEALAFNNSGVIKYRLGDKPGAVEWFNKAVPLLEQLEDRSGQAAVLANLGSVEFERGETQKALDHFKRALQLATEVNEPQLMASVLYGLMVVNQTEHPGLAIWYGKKAVNQLQQVRGSIQGLDKELQTSFLASKEQYFRSLAGLLIASGRLPEAEQTLNLLKEQEYQDYVRGEAANTLSPLAMTPEERKVEADYEKSTADRISLGQERGALEEEKKTLRKLPTQTEDQKARLIEVQKRLDVVDRKIAAADDALQGFYGRLYTFFGTGEDANNKLDQVKGSVTALEAAVAESPRTVALYTLVSKDRYRVIVVTQTGTVAGEYAISEADLNAKVEAFSAALKDRGSNPKPLAEELYKILVAPVRAALDQAHAATLVWSLDGVLRYIPMAALFDGKQYLVEQYNNVTITPASFPQLKDEPNVSKLSVAAMGISRQYRPGLPALKAVASELQEIVKEAQPNGSQGVLPGTILLDNQFTEKAMEDQLGDDPPVVHIASHFVFTPGDASKSFLLLAGKEAGGDGEGHGFSLEVAEFRRNISLSLKHTDLLTLSACETGMSSSASNGQEVDGLGSTAIGKGAKSVISTLWEVDDSSTGLLMADFYQRWSAGAGKVSKVEALRQAQLDLLLGMARVSSATNDDSGRGFVQGKPQQPALAGFTHPYYWAPFVLMGNWK
jgi:CHAT domain-containing protein/Flp pilus assembly protein TadD